MIKNETWGLINTNETWGDYDKYETWRDYDKYETWGDKILSGPRTTRLVSGLVDYERSALVSINITDNMDEKLTACVYKCDLKWISLMHGTILDG